MEYIHCRARSTPVSIAVLYIPIYHVSHRRETSVSEHVLDDSSSYSRHLCHTSWTRRVTRQNAIHAQRRIRAGASIQQIKNAQEAYSNLITSFACMDPAMTADGTGTLALEDISTLSVLAGSGYAEDRVTVPSYFHGQ